MFLQAYLGKNLFFFFNNKREFLSVDRNLYKEWVQVYTLIKGNFHLSKIKFCLWIDFAENCWEYIELFFTSYFFLFYLKKLIDVNLIVSKITLISKFLHLFFSANQMKLKSFTRFRKSLSSMKTPSSGINPWNRHSQFCIEETYKLYFSVKYFISFLNI